MGFIELANGKSIPVGNRQDLATNFHIDTSDLSEIQNVVELLMDDDNLTTVKHLDDDGNENNIAENQTFWMMNLYPGEETKYVAVFMLRDKPEAIPQTIAEKAAAYDILMGGA